MSFKIGDKVHWTSQSAGFRKQKSGEIIEVIPAGQEVTTLRSSGNPRNHESYIVKVGSTKYWPIVKYLSAEDPFTDSDTFTPGWRYEFNAYDPHLVLDSEGYLVCEVANNTVMTPDHAAKQKKNTVLISKSPEMRALLEKSLTGYRVLKTMLKRHGMIGGVEVAQEHIEDIEKLLSEIKP